MLQDPFLYISIGLAYVVGYLVVKIYKDQRKNQGKGGKVQGDEPMPDIALELHFDNEADAQTIDNIILSAYNLRKEIIKGKHVSKEEMKVKVEEVKKVNPASPEIKNEEDGPELPTTFDLEQMEAMEEETEEVGFTEEGEGPAEGHDDDEGPKDYLNVNF